MRRLAWIAAALLIALGSVGVLAQTTTPTPEAVNPEIELQIVEDSRGREWEVDPFDVFNCYSTKRTTELVAPGESESTLDMQCFIRVGSQMTPIDPFQTDDIGVTVAVAVGDAIVSKPQVAADAPGGLVNE